MTIATRIMAQYIVPVEPDDGLPLRTAANGLEILVENVALRPHPSGSWEIYLEGPADTGTFAVLRRAVAWEQPLPDRVLRAVILQVDADSRTLHDHADRLWRGWSEVVAEHRARRDWK